MNTSRCRLPNFSMAVALAGSVIPLTSAMAQTAGTQSDQTVDTQKDNADQPLIEPNSTQIVVTARRISESLQDVPIAVTALSQDDLERIQVSNITDLSGLAPNLQVFATAGTNNATTAYIRGIGQDNQLYAFEPGVGIYLDDVYLARMQTGLLEALDLERVEILRGPQGTLYGKNTNGGAIRFISQAPTDTLEGSARLVAGNYDRFNARAMLNVPLSDSIAVRSNVLYKNRDGFYRNLLDGETYGDIDLLVARVSALMEPSANLRITLSGDVTRDRSESVFGTPLIATPNPYFGLPNERQLLGSLTPFLSNSDMESMNDQDVWGLSANVELELGDTILRSISGYRDLEFSQNLDLDGHPVPILHSIQNQSTNQFSQEFQIQSEPFANVNVVAGLYYFEEESAQRTATEGLVISENNSELETRSYAGYVNMSTAITKTLSASLGLRYTEEAKEFVNALSLFGVPLFTDQAGSNDWNRWLPSLSLELDLSDNVMTYIRYAEGFKSGGFNPQFIGDPNQTSFYDEETVTTYEIGLKSTLSMINLNIAAFYNDFEDYQAAVSVTGFAGFPVNTFTNAASYESYGLEVEFFGSPADNLTLSSSFAFFEGEFGSFINPGTGQDLSNNKLPNAPSLQATFSAEYTAPLSSQANARLGGSVIYRDNYFTEVSNTAEFEQEAFLLMNAYAAIDLDDRLSVTASIKNITNTAYLVDGIPLDFGPIATRTAFFGDPRTYEIALALEF